MVCLRCVSSMTENRVPKRRLRRVPMSGFFLRGDTLSGGLTSEDCDEMVSESLEFGLADVRAYLFTTINVLKMGIYLKTQSSSMSWTVSGTLSGTESLGSVDTILESTCDSDL